VKTLVRSLFVWLLLLALPYQGVAAARMLPTVSGMAMAPAAHAAPAAHPCHAMQPDAAAALPAAPAGEDHHPGGKGHGACADCCIAVAPIPTRIVPPACAPPSVAIPFRAGHVPSVDPALPERPPRLLAA